VINKKLDYISRKLGQLEIIKQLPDQGIEYDQLVNRAIDVISASFNYLAVHIRHEARRLGVIGKHLDMPEITWTGSIATALLKGDENCTLVDADLSVAVEEFNCTLSHLGHGIGIRTFELGTRTLEVVEGNAHFVYAAFSYNF
jgi:hypothetical protein